MEVVADGLEAARVGGVALQAARARKERSYPELVGEGGRADSWCSQRKSVDDGQLRQLVLSVPLRGQDAVRASVHQRGGAGDGGGFSHVLRQRLSCCRCWSTGLRFQQVVKLLLFTMSYATASSSGEAAAVAVPLLL